MYEGKLFDPVEIDILKNNVHLILYEYWLSFEKLLLFIELLYCFQPLNL